MLGKLDEGPMCWRFQTHGVSLVKSLKHEDWCSVVVPGATVSFFSGAEPVCLAYLRESNQKYLSLPLHQEVGITGVAIRSSALAIRAAQKNDFSGPGAWTCSRRMTEKY